MKKTFRTFALMMALVMGLSCCAGLAESAAQPSDAEMEMFLQMMQMIPGMDQFDWVGFAEEFEALKASGAEITLENCLPEGAWAIAGAMMMGGDQSSEDSGMEVDVQVSGNDMVAVYKLKEQVDEATAKMIADSVAGSFESPDALLNMKGSIEDMAASGINIETVTMTLKFLNADDSVIYEKTITYADVKDLEAAPAA